MIKRIVYAILANALFSLGVAAQDPTINGYTQIDYPGAIATAARGVNARKDVVGFYVDQANKTHGFLLSGQDFTTIDYPGATITVLDGINDRGDIVGTYQIHPSAPGGDFHGFLLHKGVFTNIQFPGHLNTITQRITDSGDIVGCYHDQDTMGTMHGIVVKDGIYFALDGTYQNVNLPASMNNGSMPGGILAGLYTDMMSKTHGYLLKDGNLVPFDFPGSVFTTAWDINARGQIVGVYRDSSGHVHGYVTSNGDLDVDSRTFTSVDYPEANATQAFGINDEGDVVGQFVDQTGHTHAFIFENAT